jgi:hypothetical protein
MIAFSVLPDLFRHPPSFEVGNERCAERWSPEQVRGDGSGLEYGTDGLRGMR